MPPAKWALFYPPSPKLTDRAVVNRWSDAELFWISKHGIKDTAMIGLQSAHKDEDIRSIAAIVRQIPDMTAEDYQAMGRAYQATQKPGADGIDGEPPAADEDDGSTAPPDDKE